MDAVPALPPGSAKTWFNRFDHAAIYVIIAGSVAPLRLGALRGAWGWTLFGILRVWHLLVIGGSACDFFAALWHAQ